MLRNNNGHVTRQYDEHQHDQRQNAVVPPYIGGGVLDDGPRRPSPWVPPEISGADVPLLTWRQQYCLLRTLREIPAFQRDFLDVLGLGEVQR